MAKVCPLCNGLQAVTQHCPCCGGNMADGGVVSNYLGPYSPYMDRQSLPLQTPGCCWHRLYCRTCRYDCHVPLALVTM